MVNTDDPIEPSNSSRLLSRARQGDAEAYGALIAPLQTRLWRQAVLLSGDPVAADDLVSETLVAAWTSLSRYNDQCRFSTWLHSILFHRHHKAVRSAQARPVSLARLPVFEADKWDRQYLDQASKEPSPMEASRQREDFVLLRESIEKLPTRHRQVVWLRFFEDASLEDIGRVTGCSLGTVKSRLHYALEKLRKMKVNLSNPTGDK